MATLLRRPLAALLVLALCGAHAVGAANQRNVKFEISVDGKLAFTTNRGDSGEDADTVWRYLNDLPLDPVKGFRVEADGSNPLRAALKGKVVIFAEYGGRAETARLNLVRGKPGAQWRVAPEDVERTLKTRKKPAAAP